MMKKSLLTISLAIFVSFTALPVLAQDSPKEAEKSVLTPEQNKAISAQFDQIVKLTDELTAVLKTIKDKETAKKTIPDLLKIADKIKAINKAFAPKLTDAYEATEEQETALMKASDQVMKELDRLSSLGDLGPEFGEAIQSVFDAAGPSEEDIVVPEVLPMPAQ